MKTLITILILLVAFEASAGPDTTTTHEVTTTAYMRVIKPAATGLVLTIAGAVVYEKNIILGEGLFLAGGTFLTIAILRAVKNRED